jgi:hypothetical protein
MVSPFSRRTKAKTPRRSTTRAAEKAAVPASHVQADRIPGRQLAQLVSWTLRERLRVSWYRLRLATREMNYAAYWMVDCRIAAPAADPTEPTRARY